MSELFLGFVVAVARDVDARVASRYENTIREQVARHYPSIALDWAKGELHAEVKRLLATIATLNSSPEQKEPPP